MIPLKMLIVFGLLLVLRSSTVSAEGAECVMADNSTVADGTELHNTGCHREVCRDGEVKQEKICPEGFTMVNYGGTRTTCLKIVKTRMDWTSALQQCEAYSQKEEGIGKAGLFEAPNDDKYDQVKMYGLKCLDSFLPASVPTSTMGPTSTYSAAAAATTKTTTSYTVAPSAMRVDLPLDSYPPFEATFRVSADAMTPCGGKFTCANGECLESGRMCDNIKGCADESDETYCLGLCDYWAGADNIQSVSQVEWKSSSKKVDGVSTSTEGMCLAIVDGEKKLFNCSFEALYPMCEVCSSKGKVDKGCEYNKQLVKEDTVADNDDCSTTYCRKGGKLETEPKCPGNFTYISKGEIEGCYLLFEHDYTREEARNRCERMLGGLQTDGKAQKRLASRANPIELDLIAEFLEENLSGDNPVKDVWLDFEEDHDMCSFIMDGEMDIIEDKADCENKRANALCEACYSEGDQKDNADSEPEKDGCLYKKSYFEIGDELEPSAEDCKAIVCVGKDKWHQKDFGEQCCISDEGELVSNFEPLDGDKPVRENPDDKCVSIVCNNGTIIKTNITCGCKGDKGQIYPDGHILSENTDPDVCEKEVCEDGTIATHPLPEEDCSPKGCTHSGKSYKNGDMISKDTDPSKCEKKMCENGVVKTYKLNASECPNKGCKEGSTTLNTGEQICVWTKKLRKRCKVGTCKSNGDIEYVSKGGKKNCKLC